MLDPDADGPHGVSVHVFEGFDAASFVDDAGVLVLLVGLVVSGELLHLDAGDSFG